VLAPVVDGDDVGVIEARGGAGLDVEAAPILVGERAVVAARHELDGDVAPELQVAGASILGETPDLTTRPTCHSAALSSYDQR